MRGRLSARLCVGVLALSAALPATARNHLEPPSPAAERPMVAEGDSHYARRSDGRVGDRADSGEILEALTAYDRAALAPDNVEARWKLARALYFRGAYTALDADARKGVFEKARRTSEEAIAILARRARGAQGFAGLSSAGIAAAVRAHPDAPPAFFWAAVSWGEWALSVGKLAAVKMGAAAKIRDDALVLIALDPRFEDGGGYRILGRLHDQAPRIPLLTWWVSRKEALANLRRAVTTAPQNLVNLHFLAEALARGNSAERAEAIGMEKAVVAGTPSSNHLVEELHIQEEAKRNLVEWRR